MYALLLCIISVNCGVPQGTKTRVAPVGSEQLTRGRSAVGSGERKQVYCTGAGVWAGD